MYVYSSYKQTECNSNILKYELHLVPTINNTHMIAI